MPNVTTPDIDTNSYFRTEWTILYAILFIIFLLLFVAYLINILPDMRSPTPKLPGYQISQVLFLIALAERFVGYLVWMILYQCNKTLPKLSAVFCGIPGYIMTIAFCQIFFLWCSISMNLILNDSSNYFQTIGKWSGIVGALIGSLGVVFILFLSFTPNVNPSWEKKYHTMEVCLAIVRDLICAAFISIFLYDIIRKLKRPLCHLRSTSSSLSVMSLLLIASLVVRAVSTIVYFIITNGTNKQNYRKRQRESFVNTVLGQVLGEVLPCYMIFRNRKKTGLLSVYDELT